MTMRIIILLSVVGVALAYTDVDDTINIEALAADRAQLKQIVDCELSRGPCNKQAAAYKSHTLESVKNACANCDDIQKHQVHVLLYNVRKNFPDDYNRIKAMYDPEGKYFATFEEAMNKF